MMTEVYKQAKTKLISVKVILKLSPTGIGKLG